MAQFVKCNVAALTVHVNVNTGYLNVTNFCTYYNMKLSNVLKQVNVGDFLRKIQMIAGREPLLCNNAVMKICTSLPACGTYAHPIVFVTLALWISADAYTRALQILDKYFGQSSDTVHQFLTLVSIINNQTAVLNVRMLETGRVLYEYKFRHFDKVLVMNDERYMLVDSMVVNEMILFFESTVNQQHINEFLLKTYPNRGDALTKYVRSIYGLKYYQPILFLRFLFFVNLDYYIRFIYLIFQLCFDVFLN